MSSMPNFAQQEIIEIIELLFTQVAKGKGDASK